MPHPFQLTWNPADQQAALLLVMVTAAYLTYHYALAADRFRARLGGVMGPEALEIASVSRQRIYGGLLLGGASLLTVLVGLGESPQAYGLGAPDWTATAAWFVGLGVILMPVLQKAARRPQQWLTYPQMRLGHWDRRRWWINTLSWGVYLLGYEFFFRGILLFWLVAHLGVWGGILTMNALYAFAHLNKDAGETWGSALIGVLFALMTLQTGAIWAAFAVHWLIATCSETFAIRANPALRWQETTD
jgi:membrane protease YdiL (CAAX protease family)